jgi:hypothetical protein
MIVERFEILRTRKIEPEVVLISIGLPMAMVGVLLAIICMVYSWP